MGRRKRGSAEGDAESQDLHSVSSATVQALVGVGFSEMEAQAYAAMLAHPGTTAYRLAQALGKSQASVTLALRGLVRKGAAVAGDDTPMRYEPVSVPALISQLKEGFGQRVEAAEAMLEAIPRGASRDRIRRLVSRDDALAEAKALLGRASESVVGLFSRRTLDLIASDLQAATKTSRVVVMTFSDYAIPGADVLVSRRSPALEPSLQVDVMVLIGDAREMLLAFFEPDTGEVAQAVWTNSSLLVGLFHNGIVSDIILNTQPVIDEIGSPNRFLLGFVPSAILEAFRIEGPVD